jgi:cytochrome c biogenesis factor
VIPEIGHFALLLALAVAGFQTVSGLAGAMTARLRLRTRPHSCSFF